MSLGPTAFLHIAAVSGIGRDGGKFGFHAYTELQSIVWPG